jgi:hypothetical protein
MRVHAMVRLMGYFARTSRYRTLALLCEVGVVVVLFLTVPMLAGATFQFRYGRLFLVPLVLGTAGLDAWGRSRLARWTANQQRELPPPGR